MKLNVKSKIFFEWVLMVFATSAIVWLVNGRNKFADSFLATSLLCLFLAKNNILKSKILFVIFLIFAFFNIYMLSAQLLIHTFATAIATSLFLLYSCFLAWYISDEKGE